ncbi:MAG: hypothetical protein JSW52_12270, partial [Candidatus Coatesbacteria bacterium]
QAKDERTLAFILERLLEVGRVLDALSLAATFRAEVYIESQFLLRLLGLVPSSIVKEDPRPDTSMIAYSIKELFDVLRKRTDVERFEVAKAEYALLPLLTAPWDIQNLVLHKMLSDDPRFFIDLICDIYKPASGGQETEIDEYKLTKAEYGYDLLQSWKTIPGTDSQGVIRESELSKWVTDARVLAKQKDRADITDQAIGRILAYAPNDPVDGAWPHQAVRNILESTESQHIKIGLTVEIHNKRGVVKKEVFEGGKQEQVLASQWREWADIVKPQWPFTGSILVDIAEDWEQLAKKEDVRADQDRIRFRG